MTAKPRSIYIEQSVVKSLIHEKGFKRTSLFNDLMALQQTGEYQIWISPENAIELALWSNHDMRKACSLALEELTEGRRMLSSYEFILFKEFVDYINLVWSESAVNIEVFQSREMENQRLFSGLIAHMAALRDYDASGAFEELVRTKKLSQLRQLKHLVDGKFAFDLLSKPAPDAGQIEMAFDSKYASMSISDIVKEIDELKIALKDLGKQKAIAQQFQKNRQSIIGFLQHSFGYPEFLCAMRSFENIVGIFNYKFLVENWTSIKQKVAKEFSPVPLPLEIASAFRNGEQTSYTYEIFIRALFASIVPSLQLPKMMCYLLCTEFEKALCKAEPPTEGLTIDIDHACSIYVCDIFLTYDDKLYSSLKAWIKSNPIFSRLGRDCAHNWGELDNLTRLRSSSAPAKRQ